MKVENTCEISGYTITLNKYMDGLIIDFPNFTEKCQRKPINMFLLLLRNTIDKVINENKYNTIYQLVTENDWIDIKNKRTGFKKETIMTNDDNIRYVMLSCNVNDILESIGLCMGIDKVLEIKKE